MVVGPTAHRRSAAAGTWLVAAAGQATPHDPTIGNRKFFHTGDTSAEALTVAYTKPFNLPAEHIDVAFVPHYFLSRQAPLPPVTESIQPRVVFASHVRRRSLLELVDRSPKAVQIKRNVPSAVVPRTELESWPIR